MNYSGVFVLTLCLFGMSCKTNKVISPEEFEGSRMILSHGGGFTGKYTVYCLLENGQLFKNSKGFDAKDPVNGFDKKVAQQIFSNYAVLGLGNQKFESYDNLNYSIIMINEYGKEHKLQWGKGQKDADKLQLFYDTIMNQIKALREKEMQTQKVQ